jgi:hypothetical protein
MTVSSLKMHTNIINNDNLEKRLFYGLAAVLLVLFLSYLYFLGTITFNIVERKALEKQAKGLASNVGTLELQDLALANKIDMAYAGELGFVEASHAIFASRAPASNLALRDHGVE